MRGRLFLAHLFLQSSNALHQPRDDGSSWSVLIAADGGFKLAARDEHQPAKEFQQDEAAWGRFNNSYLATGWSLLEVHTNSAQPDAVAAEAAGFFEGKVSSLGSFFRRICLLICVVHNGKFRPLQCRSNRTP